MIGNTERLAKIPPEVSLRERFLKKIPRFVVGTWVVLRRCMRRNTRRDLLWMVGLLFVLLGASGLLEMPVSLPFTWNYLDGSRTGRTPIGGGIAFALYSMPNFFLRWLMLYACGASVVLMPLAGLRGAQAVPRTEETPAIQETLLTELRADEICLGRLTAALWPLAGAAAVSGAFWLTVQIVSPVLPQRLLGMQQILDVHCILMGAVFMAGAVGYLFASRFSPGALWGRGAIMALTISSLGVTGIVLLNPCVQHLSNPVPFINTLLLLNPIAGIASALKLDILRTPWLYTHTDAQDYAFAYPVPLMTAGLFLAIGLVCVLGAATLMRRAYRT